MSNDKFKEPQTVEKSLSYLSWSIKELVKEIKEIKEIMQGMHYTTPKSMSKDDVPF